MKTASDVAFASIAALTLLGYAGFIWLGAAPESALVVSMGAGTTLAVLLRTAIQIGFFRPEGESSTDEASGSTGSPTAQPGSAPAEPTGYPPAAAPASHLAPAGRE